MMKIEKWSQDPAQQKKLLARAQMTHDPAMAEKVAAILADIKARGDEAVAATTEKFDGVRLSRFRVPEAEMKEAFETLDPALRRAMEVAKDNLTRFHEAQRPKPVRLETMKGVTCSFDWRPLERVGLYAPGGTAPYFSAVLMLAVPAVLAGCPRVAMCSPPRKDGSVNPAILAAAWMAGVREVYALGGAQAIAAMAYGTAQVGKVDKILGPGNAYVTMAKQLVAQDQDGAALDMPAGPSEVMVIAGAGARAAWVAADLLAQAEHDALSQAMLVTFEEAFAQKVLREVKAQSETAPRRAIIEKSLAQSRIILARDRDEALEIANLYAPEHLILHDEEAEKVAARVTTAGSVFCGPFTPETAGDYASGTNHVLPTYGAARATSGLSLFSFLKSMTIQSCTREGLAALAPTLLSMADAEGFAAHGAAVQVRLKDEL